MCIYRKIVRPFLFQFEPERSKQIGHRLIANVMPLLGSFSKAHIYPNDDLQISILGTTVANPVGLSAGFDKNGDLTHVLKYLGFGFEEVGSVSAQEHSGNPKPRLYRLPADNALINSMGLNSEGVERVSKKLRKTTFSLPVGISIAKTNKPNISASEDLLFSFRAIKDLPIFYVALNISSPNASESTAERMKTLSDVLSQISQENSSAIPILLKLSPDSDEAVLQEITELGKKFSIAGYICGSTTRERSGLKTEKAIVESIKGGAVSGPPLKPLALSVCQRVFRLKGKNQIVIGCGGISNGQDAYDFVRAGASALQLYTALVYEGPNLVRKINEELSALLKRDRLTLSEAVGIDNT